MHTPNIQGSQNQRGWVRPQLSELNINTHTQSGWLPYEVEYTLQIFHFQFDITYDKNGGS
jgi:hypothetical protein